MVWQSNFETDFTTMDQYIDAGVIFVFSAFILFIGLLFARTGRNLKSFFAGGERVPWFIGGLSSFMSFFSAGTFVAWGSIAYSQGWVAITIQWTMCIGGLVAGLFIAPRWKKAGYLTAAEFIRARFGQQVQQGYIYVFMLVSLLIKGSVLYAVSRLVSASLEFPLVYCTIILGILMIAYTAVGGLWAVMVTDILQFVVLTAAVLIVLPLTLQRAGGWQHFITHVPPGFFKPVSGDYTWLFLAAFTLYHITYIGGHWTFVQRYTSVATPRAASKVALLFAGLYIISPVIWMLPPMIYRSIVPDLAGIATENAYLDLCKLILPPGLMGLMLTGMYFSTSASANTALNVVSAVFTNDIYRTYLNPAATDKKLMTVARASSWGLGAGMILVALVVPHIGGLVGFTLSLAAVTGGPLLAPPVWGLFSQRLSGRATLRITLFCLSINIAFKILPVFNLSGLTKAGEMLLGAGLPLLLLTLNELHARRRDVTQATADNAAPAAVAIPQSADDIVALQAQNRYGLKVIAFSLVFISLLLAGLSFLTVNGRVLVLSIAAGILLLSLIPLHAAKPKH